MSVNPFRPMFEFKADRTPYRRLAISGVRPDKCGGRRVLLVGASTLSGLARQAFADLSFYLRPSFLAGLAAILDDPEASDNERFVAAALLRNAAISAEGELPLCQDTGTIAIIASKGHLVLTDGRDEEALAAGAASVYRDRNLRFSQMAPLSVFEEANTGNNRPAQIDIAAAEGEEYRFLFLAKGGGSSNKTSLFQESKAFLNERSLTAFLEEKIASLGVAACPPYRIAVVVGGLSPEMTLKTVKLATTGYLDGLPGRGRRAGIAFRDAEWESRMMDIARRTGLGAQFGGKHLAHEVRFIRLPRHAGSCPVGIGVGCNADRNLKGKITADGIFLEAVERNPARFLTGGAPFSTAAAAIDLNAPMDEIRRRLSGYPVGTLLRLSGPLVVARDIAHARLKKILDETGDVPVYFKNHPVYYAGPAKTPRGYASGSFGPTTGQRMDGYLPDFMKAGASLVTLAKGNRAPSVTEACRTYGGFYLGTIGGAAALVAKEHILNSEIIDFADLGMEAVRRIVVKDLPAFILSDDKGNNLYGGRGPKLG
jgi:fumarate hydratase, class I